MYLRTNPNSLYFGFFLSLDDRSIAPGSCAALMSCTRSEGSRAGMRCEILGVFTAVTLSAGTSDFNTEPLVWSEDRGMDGSGLGGRKPAEEDGESMVVSGVTCEYEEFLETAAVLAPTEEALVADDAMLVCELSEPTVLGMSARRGSASSAGVRAGSDTDVSRRDLATAGSSSRCVVAALETGWPTPLVVSLSGRFDEGVDDGDSCASFFTLSFSRSMARSLAALDAAGKNWAKLASEGRVIVVQSQVSSSASSSNCRLSSPLPPSSDHHISRGK